MQIDEKHIAMDLWREAFALCSAMRCAFTAAGGKEAASTALHCADLGLIIAGPSARASKLLFAAVDRLLAIIREEASTTDAHCQPAGKRPRLHQQDIAQHIAMAILTIPPIRRPIRELRPLDLEDFLLNFLATQKPVVMRKACAQWPACQKWADAGFWHSSALGPRFVPVELDYWLNEGFELMTVHDFIDHCMAKATSSNPVPGLSGGGYLAQHALLDQIPALEADVITPDYALCGPQGSTNRQIFFGPAGTVTPLHFDPYENIFCQVVGTKYIRLYAPSQSSCVYARKDNLCNNSSLEPPDLLLGEATGAYGQEGVGLSPKFVEAEFSEGVGRFPKFAEAEFSEVVLEAGDILYLPKQWWHFVKSLSTSISVAFHFT